MTTTSTITLQLPPKDAKYDSHFLISHSPIKKQRVTFEDSTLVMAEKHNENPTAVKPSSHFRKTVALGSASSWNTFELDLFHVKYEVDKYGDLESVIGSEFYQLDEANAMHERIHEVLKESGTITKDQLRTLLEDKMTMERILDGNLPELYMLLSNLQVMPTQLAIDHKKERSSKKKAMVSKSSDSGEQIQLDFPAFDVITDEPLPSVENRVGSNSTESPKTPPQKRVISGSSDTSSYNIPSSNTTPTKVEKPEPETQSLQNTLISSLIRVVWRGYLCVDWARNRKMWLKYVACVLPDNQTSPRRPDRVTAIADGALVLVTNRTDGRPGPLYWNKQGAVLGFEAKRFVYVQESNIGPEKKPVDIGLAEERARAAQMFAEMLGMVCHSAYYEQGEQMGFIVHLDGSRGSIFWAQFPTEYLRTIHVDGVHKIPDETKINLHHTNSYDLFHPTQRTDFLRHLIALIRYLAAGKGNVGHLRLPGDKIHRAPLPPMGVPVEDESAIPEWMVMDEKDEAEWLSEKASGYTS